MRRPIAIVALLVAALVLSACGSKPRRSAPVDDGRPARTGAESGAMIPPSGPAPDGGPAIPPDVSRVPEPVPRAEPPSRYGNKSPYTVLGRTYSVRNSSKGYVERGLASWYGTKFHGRLTSSREPYDMYQLTAAHKTLPLPTFVRVTNLENGRSLIVRVNDRGPFHEGRIIDLSYAAAVRLGVHIKGTAKVEVRAIDVGSPDVRQASAPPRTEPALPRAPASRPSAPASGRVYLQVGSFGDRDNARRVEERLERADIDDVFLDRERVGGRTVHRVRIGPLAARAADEVAARVQRLGFNPVTVTAD